MAEERRAIEIIIADMRRRIAKRPPLVRVLESLLEYLEHVEVSEAEHEEAIKWLHYAVKSPRMAELVYGLAQLVQSEITAGMPAARPKRMRN